MDTPAARYALATALRRHRPKILVGMAGRTPSASPDHYQAQLLTEAARFYAQLTKWNDRFAGNGAAPHRALGLPAGALERRDNSLANPSSWSTSARLSSRRSKRFVAIDPSLMKSALPGSSTTFAAEPGQKARSPGFRFGRNSSRFRGRSGCRTWSGRWGIGKYLRRLQERHRRRRTPSDGSQSNWAEPAPTSDKGLRRLQNQANEKGSSVDLFIDNTRRRTAISQWKGSIESAP